MEKIPNVAFLRTRIEFITAFFAPGEVSQIWLTFSDPQMKSENSRLTSPLFLERYRKMLVPGGIVHLKTDSAFLCEYTRQIVDVNNLKRLAYTTDLYATKDDSLDASLYEVQTFYEKMFLSQGIPITYQSFVIDKEGDYLHPTDFDQKAWREKEKNR